MLISRRNNSYRILIPMGLLILAGLACARGETRVPDKGVLSSDTILHDGLERSYVTLVPVSYEDDERAPLVLALHGGGGDGERMCRLEGGVQEMAEVGGFIVVCPEGVENHWNDGRELDKWRAHAEDIDDVGFLLSLIDHISEGYSINPERIFVTGMSNGGKVSLRLACEAADIFAAAAPVIASLPADLDCQPSEPISILIMNGMEDPLVPWEGGQVHFYRQELGAALSTPDTVAFWVAENGCNPAPVSEWLPDIDPEDKTRIKKEVYSECDAQTSVVLFSVEGGGHTWPGGPQYVPAMVIGRVSHDLHTGEEIWSFFAGE